MCACCSAHLYQLPCEVPTIVIFFTSLDVVLFSLFSEAAKIMHKVMILSKNFISNEIFYHNIINLFLCVCACFSFIVTFLP